MKLESILLGFFQSIILFLSPIQGLLIAVGAAIMADTFFGVRLALKEKTYKTKILRKGLINKMLLYQLAVITFFIIDYNALNAWLVNDVGIDYLLTKLLSTVLIFVEMSSINETSSKLYKQSFYKTFLDIIKKLKDFRKHLKDEFK